MRIAIAILMALAAQGDVLDRIAVTIGKQVITLNDVLRDLRVAAFLDQKPVDLSPEQKRKAADRLVDQLLILQEASFSRVTLAENEDAQKTLDQIKASLFTSDAEFRASLARYGISQEDVINHLLAGLRAMRFTDLRFRPEVQLSDDELQDRYARLVADWRAKNSGQPPTFEEAREQVEKLLTDERTAQELDRWLGAQRAETEILYREPAFQ